MSDATRPAAKVASSTLVALGAAIFVVGNDFTALGIIVPTLEHQFSADLSTVQWVVNGYALAFAMVVVPAGRFTDLFGARRVFTIGAAIFAISSIAIAIAPEIWVLLGARVIQGIGGGLMWTSVLAMVFGVFGSERAGTAGAFVLGIAGLGNALGPIDAGILTDTIGWEWVLLLNVPLCGFAVWAVNRERLPGSEPGEAEGTIDWRGIALLAAGLMSLLLTLDMVPREGWLGAQSVAGFGLSALLFGGFVVEQRRAGERALIPPEVARNPRFVTACACAALIATTFFAVLLYGPQVLTKVLDMNTVEAGLAMAPLMATFAATAYFGGRLYDRFGALIAVACGGALMTLGTLLLALIPMRPEFADLIPGFILLGIGAGIVFPANTAAGISALPESRRGLAGGILYMAQVAGGAIGIGAATSVTAARTADVLAADGSLAGLDRGELVDIQQILAGTETAGAVVAKLGADAAGRVELLARDAFVEGVRSGLLIDVAFGAIGVAVAVAGFGAWSRSAAKADS